MKILIDNGHGVNTSGKCSPDKRLREYKWARETAKALYNRLLAEGVDARLIVPEENDISISERVLRVNALCDQYGSSECLLVSIHNNAAEGDGKWHSARGFSAFVSKNASTKSKNFAAMLTDAASRRGLMGNRSVPAGRFWTWSWTTADIGILKRSKCPAVLTENLFQDNVEDVNYLLSDMGRKTIVDLHVEAINSYIKEYGK